MKFKIGDKVRRIDHANTLDSGAVIEVGDVLTVAGLGHDGGLLFDIFGVPRARTWSDPAYFELVSEPDTQPSGHLPDGSSVQKHSAGGLYPAVLVWRDSKAPDRKYDVGLLLPGHSEIWFKTSDDAVAAGEAWLKGRA